MRFGVIPPRNGNLCQSDLFPSLIASDIDYLYFLKRVRLLGKATIYNLRETTACYLRIYDFQSQHVNSPLWRLHFFQLSSGEIARGSD